MSNNPSVRLFVLNWNGKDTTRDCINSLLSVTYDNVKIHLIDNGSENDSVASLKAWFPDLDIISLAENIGFTGGSNYGIRELSQYGSEYICFVSNDVVVDPDFLTKLVAVAETDTTIGLLNPKIFYQDPGDRLWYDGGYFNWWMGRGIHRNYRKKLADIKIRAAEQTSIITGCVYLAQTNVINQAGGFDERYFNYAEDTDLALRVRRAGYSCYYVPDAIVWHKESYDIRKNQGRPYQMYYITRNVLLLMSTHATNIQWLLFFAGYLLIDVGLRSLYYVLRKDRRTARAVIKGYCDFRKRKFGKQEVN